MEVFIREKSCETCPFANKERPNFICGDAIANDFGLKTNFSVCKLNYFANEENCPLKSLDQHDRELLNEFAEKLKNIIYENSLVYDGLDEPNFSRNKMYIRSANVCDFMNELLK